MAVDILVVDDERDIRELVSGVLSDEGYECRVAGDSGSALGGGGGWSGVAATAAGGTPSYSSAAAAARRVAAEMAES